MNFPELSDITPAKAEALKERIARLRIDLRLVEEQFIRGSGAGGQKINKTSNAVLLKYPPLNLIVRCQRERKRSVNRFLALRELVDEIELIVSPSTSPRLKEIQRIRRKKARSARRNRLSPGPAGE
ncbi:MAG TPA: peptide chain release factor-like protein [Elusimicrobia bacterium]|nr:peptide chain release factor-like protein [Elusimicrobiota bacterium]